MKGYWENLRPFEKRVVVGVATMVFAVFNLWFVLPHYSDLNKMKRRKEEAESKLTRWQSVIGQTGFYEGEIKKLKGEGLDVPAADQALQFSRTITDEQMRSGVSPRGAGRIITTTNEFFLEQTQTVNIESGEQQLVDFLFNLGSGNSLIRVRDLRLNPDAQHQQLAASIKVVASFQKNPSSKPGSPSTKPGSTKLAGVPSPAGVNRPAPAPQPGKTTPKSP